MTPLLLPSRAEEASFLNTLSPQEGALLGFTAAGALALLPSEMTFAGLALLGRTCSGLLVGPLPQILEADALAGEAINAAVVEGASVFSGAFKFFTGGLGKLTLFGEKAASADIIAMQEALKQEIISGPQFLSTEEKFFKTATLRTEHDFYNPGDMPSLWRRSFIGSRYQTYTMEEDTILYRAGSSEVELGQFFSFDKPVSELQVRIDKHYGMYGMKATLH